MIVALLLRFGPFIIAALALGYAVWVDLRTGRQLAEGKAELAALTAQYQVLRDRHAALTATLQKFDAIERSLAQQRAQSNAAMQTLRRKLAELSDEIRRSPTSDAAIAVIRRRLQELGRAAP